VSAARLLLQRAHERVAKRAARGFLGGGPKGRVRVGSSQLKARVDELNARNYKTRNVVTMDGDVVSTKVATRIGGKRGAVRLTRLSNGLAQRKRTNGAFWHPRPRTGVYKRRPLLSRGIRSALMRRARLVNRDVLAGRPGAIGEGRRVGEAQVFLTRRAQRSRNQAYGRIAKVFDEGRVIFKSAKADVTGKYVAGWFSVVEKDGELVEDIQGDVITMDDLREGAHEFVKAARIAKVMHDGDQIGNVVESVLIDDAFAKAHGISHGERGWWGAIEVTDEKAQARVRKGELPAFSIGGGGKREPFHKRARAGRSLKSLRARFGE